ncbi:MAG TPA: hypothetical protein PKD10_00810 [Paracoccaceae bacterium]|nr:hypothetical protein [Paracoccaceae bacterium]HMO70154.1 hypothetical protein [Paracoccaceae bacterium]
MGQTTETAGKVVRDADAAVPPRMTHWKSVTIRIVCRMLLRAGKKHR